jgi:hypothetical protein
MARYVDVDMDVSNYVTVWDCDCSEFGKQTVMAVDDLQYLPTADVAPRAEVDKAKLNGYELGKREVARRIMNETRQALLNMVLANSMGENYDIEKRFAEIEKKYTDATDTNVGGKEEG